MHLRNFDLSSRRLLLLLRFCQKLGVRVSAALSAALGAGRVAVACRPRRTEVGQSWFRECLPD
jgi:hypothetical protein